MVKENKKILAGAIILAMSISTITQTSYASEEIGDNSNVTFEGNQGTDKDSYEDFKESQIGVEDSDTDINEDDEYETDEEIDPPTSENKLEDIKESLKSDVNLSDLSDELKNDYSKQIDEADSEKDLEDIEARFFADLLESFDDQEADDEDDLTQSSDEGNEESSDDKELEISDLDKDSDQVGSQAEESDIETIREELRSKLVDAMASGKIDSMKLSDFTERIASADSDQSLKAIEAEIYQALGEELPEEDDDSETEPVEDDLAEERQLAKDQIAEIATDKNMPEDLVNEYSSRIDAAKDMEEMFDIVMEANDWENPDSIEPEVDPLEEEKELYNNSIDKLENLDDERKAYYKSEIDKANGTEEFRSILDNAQAENNENAPVEDFDFKGIYKDLIDELEYLSEEQKQVYKDQIDAIDEEADGAEDAIQEIWISAQTQNEGQEPMEDEEELTELREIAKSVVDELENLSEEEKQAFKDQIDGEKSFAGIDGILDKAKDQDKNNAAEWLESLREGYIAKLPGYENLTDDQRAAYEKQFKEAKDQEAMRLIDYDAQITNQDQEPVDENLDEEILEDYKDLALEEIEALENLTDEKVKEDFINQVKAVKLGDEEDAFNIAAEKINAIREEASAWKAKDDSLEKAKEAGKTAINALDNLTEEEKQKYLEEVDQASDKEAINKAVEEAEALNDGKSDLEDAKKSAKETIANLANLTNDQKEGYPGQIDNADSKEEIDEIVASAKAKDAENLKKAKKDAKSSIDELSQINEDKKQSYKEEIDRPSTDTIAKVDEIVNRAKNDGGEELPEEDLLKSNKSEYKKMIDNLPLLTSKEKESFKGRIDKASSLDQIKSTYSEALNLVDSRRNNDDDFDYLRDYIIDRINELENLRDFEKENFIAKVKYANTFENIFDIYIQAIKSDNNAMIYVPIGYEYIPSGYYYRYDLYNSRLQLLEAYKNNRITVAATKILLENYPNTVKNVKDKLEKLVKESEELQKQAEAMLKEYDEILILDYKAEI